MLFVVVNGSYNDQLKMRRKKNEEKIDAGVESCSLCDAYVLRLPTAAVGTFALRPRESSQMVPV